ncbi:hypothetical protein ALC53_05633 [Atta colombica]|uniref:Uncharacterized protein n=1 Tax=Atta colombica TaxID=520822 RepID=A0A151I3P3_9HYME|nr:hypothetical protein ALC53_05633 [Atta colombica]
MKAFLLKNIKAKTVAKIVNRCDHNNIKKVIQEALIEYDQNDLTKQVRDNANSDSPAKCAFTINKIAYAPNKSIRIEANKPDLTKLKSYLEFANTGLKIMENIKVSHIYRPKDNKRAIISCILKVSPVVRRTLMRRVYLRYAACKYAIIINDHIRIL